MNFSFSALFSPGKPGRQTLPFVSFAVADVSASEADGTVDLTVSLNVVSDTEVSVPYVVTGTATDPDDYGIDASPLVIAAGTKTGTITVTLVDDEDAESDETIIVTLGTPTDATVGAIGACTITVSSTE